MIDARIGLRAAFAFALVIGALSLAPSASAVTVNTSTSARIDYTAPSGTWDIGAIYLNFGADDFGPGDALKLEVFDASNARVSLETYSASSNVSSAGFLVHFFPDLTTTTFYAVIGAITGSFDVVGGGDLTEIANQGTRETAFPEISPVVTATPIPGSLFLFASGLGALGLLRRRRKR